VNAPKAGRVMRIHVKEGQAVQEGQLLADID
jgi:multidrug efflux pump subunit AcrA (membrane-fusion protein)